tara:strand:- start:1211 stop:1915 length:705 start_codon:yes stop_codon:yes gene_type:complete
MAISVDNVYKTVLTILNKENRGYVTPREFNDYARQSQLEIFESYFSAANRAVGNESDYSDTVRNVGEKISYFENEASLSKSNFTNYNTFSTPDYYAYPADFYRLGIVNAAGVFVQEISNRDYLFVSKAPLTTPTITNPVYLLHERGLVVKPTALTTVNISYVRKPNSPSWVGTSVAGQIIATPANAAYNDFELHKSEETELVAKIVGLAGVTIKAIDVAQVAAQKETQIIQSEQ